MKNKKVTILSMIFLLALPVWAGGLMQWKNIDRKDFSQTLEALNKMVAHMQHCQVNMTDASFDDYNTAQFHEQSRGFYKRNESEYHTCMLGIHTIQGKDCRIVIDSAKKVIIVGDPTNAMNDIMDASVYAALLKSCSTIRVAQSEGYTYYRLEFSANHPLTAYEVSLKDSLPQKIVMYYSKDVKKGNVVSKPRMEIVFSDWKTSRKYSSDVFDIEKFVDKKGDEYFLKPQYATKFKLLDERVLTKTAKK